MTRFILIGVCSFAAWILVNNEHTVTGQETMSATVLARLKAAARAQEQGWNEKSEASFSSAFRNARIEFPIASRESEVTETVTKVAGEIDVLHAFRRSIEDREFNSTMEPRKFPLETDFSLIRKYLTEFPQEKRAERAITAWYLMRCNGVVADYGAPRFRDLDKNYVAFAQSLGFVRIVSVPTNANVEVVGWGEWDPTDTEGFLPPGKVLIYVRLGGYVPQVKLVEVKQDKSHTVEFQLKKSTQ